MKGKHKQINIKKKDKLAQIKYNKMKKKIDQIN